MRRTRPVECASLADPDLKKTVLHALHVELGAKMVPFGGYDMPVQYPAGILAEHNHTRAAAGLFDVSHMGQVTLHGPDAADALETLVPGDIRALKEGATRYSMFTNAEGGILDDLMITNRGDRLFLVVNAGCKEADIAHMRSAIGGRTKIDYHEDRALLALQGPQAATVMARLAPASVAQKFMTFRTADVAGIPCYFTRSGYTGEDGWEISVPADRAVELARAILANPEVKPIGLGARDSLRLEAGLCLYGHDIDTTTTPIEADLQWSISKRRRAEGGFPGAARIRKELAEGPARKRVGILPEGRAPAREGTEIVDASGAKVGTVTSGGFGPSVNGPVCMGYVQAALASPGTSLGLVVRGKTLPARVVGMPFTPHRYFRG
ncbi:MAG: glycine cleavage system aminomethyltransferase GcvT [Alphaproteobacteria bacterium]|nr:glycine cleavage system aminomethyltransferase GcvT [Alphaproteobacteria bacterium]